LWVPLTILFVLLFSFEFYFESKYTQNTNQIQLTLGLENRLNILKNYISIMEKSQRDYILTLDEGSLQTYHESVSYTFEGLSRIKDDIQNENIGKIVEDLKLMLDEKTNQIEKQIVDKKTLGNKFLYFTSAKELSLDDKIDVKFAKIFEYVALMQTTQTEEEGSFLVFKFIIRLLISVLIGLIFFTLFYQNKYIAKKYITLNGSISQSNKDFLLNKGEGISGFDDNNLSELVSNLKNAIVFIREIGKQNFKVEFSGFTQAVEEANQNNLAGELMKMKQMLQNAQIEDNKRRREDEFRSWSTEGIARFSELIRQDSSDLTTLSDKILKFVVEYLGANQGGLYLFNSEDGDNYLELKSCYAFSSKKFITQKWALGEGLLGNAALEMKTYFITQVPDNYISISSGLGDAKPRSLLIVPMILDGKLYGLYELASFKVFEKYEIEFVEHISEATASTIMTAAINAKTSYLLEQTRSQTEQMSAQEEEMRQNMEELIATQEEASRKSEEVLKTFEALNQLIGIIEMSYDGKILKVNSFISEILGMKEETIVGKYHFDFIAQHERIKPEYKQMWLEMKKGNISVSERQFFMQNLTPVWFLEMMKPINDNENKLDRIFCIMVDIKILKNNENDLIEMIKTQQQKLDVAQQNAQNSNE